MMKNKNILILVFIITVSLQAMEKPERTSSLQYIVFSSLSKIERPHLLSQASFFINETIVKLKKGCIFDAEVDVLVIGANEQKMLSSYSDQKNPHSLVYTRPPKGMRKKRPLVDITTIVGYIHPISDNVFKMIPKEEDSDSQDNTYKPFFSCTQELKAKPCDKKIKSLVIKINEPCIMPGSDSFYYSTLQLHSTIEKRLVLKKCEGKFFLISESQEIEKMKENFLVIKEDKDFHSIKVLRKIEQAIFMISDAEIIKKMGIEASLFNDIQKVRKINGEIIITGIIETEQYNKQLKGELFRVKDKEIKNLIDKEIKNNNIVSCIQGNILLIKDLKIDDQKKMEFINLKYEGESAITAASDDLRKCYINALNEGLKITEDKKEKSIAFSTLSRRLGFPQKEAVAVTVNALIDFVKSNKGYQRIELFAKKRSEFELYHNLLTVHTGINKED